MLKSICFLCVRGSIIVFTHTNLFPPPETESVAIRQILETYIERVTGTNPAIQTSFDSD